MTAQLHARQAVDTGQAGGGHTASAPERRAGLPRESQHDVCRPTIRRQRGMLRGGAPDGGLALKRGTARRREEQPRRQASARPKLRHYGELLVMVVAEWLVRPLSRRWTLRLAGWLGWVLMLFRIRRRHVEANLTIAFGPAPPGDAARRGLVRAIYQHTALTLLEFLQGAVHRREILARIEGDHVLTALLQAGPILVVTGHIGNWEAFGALLVAYGQRGAMLAKPIHNPLLQRRFVQFRTKLSQGEVIITGKSSMRVRACVREGKSVGFVSDQDAGSNGIFVDYFGCPASTARGPALFAVKLGMPLVPMFMVREATPEKRLVVQVGTPLYADPSADREAEVRRLTEGYTRQLEDVVRRHPADYFWLHRRWKTQPEDSDADAGHCAPPQDVVPGLCPGAVAA